MHRVSVRVITTTDLGKGQTSEAVTSKTVAGVLFAPEGASESVASDSPRVIGRASLYGAFPRLDADDEIEHPSSCCRGGEFAHGRWSVVGGSRGWAPGMVVVPIDRASGA